MLSLFTIFTLIISHFDFYIFTQSWLPGFCQTNRQNICLNQNTSNKFIIHGLWPTWKNGSWPQYCQNITLKESDLNNIIVDLDYHWSDSGKENWKFWEHEWDKHGTCALESNLIKTSLDYFSSSLWIAMRSNFNNILYQSSIIPSNTSSYSRKQLSLVFGNGIVCKIKNGRYLLTEVRIIVSNSLVGTQELADDGSCGDINQNIYLVNY